MRKDDNKQEPVSGNKSEESRENLEGGAQRKNTTADLDKLTEESDKNRTKKPGSQSNSGGSGRHNNGRGGGK